MLFLVPIALERLLSDLLASSLVLASCASCCSRALSADGRSAGILQPTQVILWSGRPFHVRYG